MRKPDINSVNFGSQKVLCGRKLAEISGPLICLILLMLFSCKEEKEKKNGDYFSETTFSLDTVIIDPGG
jgi:hypothetical protein